MTRYNTLLLDRSKWDLVIDSAGNIATGEPPYSLAQDVASAVRLFINELWYAPKNGIPYFEDILGKLPPQALLIGYIEKAALTVPGVVKAKCIISSFDSRTVTGEIQFIDEANNKNAIQF